MEARLCRFYARHNPSRLHDPRFVRSLANAFRCRENMVWRRLQYKYLQAFARQIQRWWRRHRAAATIQRGVRRWLRSRRIRTHATGIQRWWRRHRAAATIRRFLRGRVGHYVVV